MIILSNKNNEVVGCYIDDTKVTTLTGITELPKEPEQQVGVVARLFIDPITNELAYKYIAIGSTLEEVKTSKITQMQELYNKNIYETFKSTAFDGKTEEEYSCSEVDQARINGEVTIAMAVKAGMSQEALSWKNINQAQCVSWTADAMIKLGTDLHKFETEKTDYLEALIVYINSLTTIDAVNAVNWGMTIPTAS